MVTLARDGSGFLLCYAIILPWSLFYRLHFLFSIFFASVTSLLVLRWRRHFKYITERKKYTMKKILSLLIAAAMLLTMLTGCGSSPSGDNSDGSISQSGNSEPEANSADDHYPVTIKNVNFALEETEFTYEKAPERVITFWDNSLETMLALGLGDKIIMAVGVNEEGILPELKEEYARIKENFEFYNDFTDSNAALSKETAIMMEPDFILAWKSSFNDKTLQDTTYWNEKGVGTYIALNSNDVSEYRTLENEYTDILNIGKIFNVEDRANEIVDELKAEVERVTSATAGQEKKTVLVIEFLGDSIVNYGETMLAGDMVKAMGGDLLDAPSDLGKEDIINLNPDVLLVIGDTEEAAAKITEDPGFASLQAVQNSNVYNLPLSYVYTSGVRTIYGLNTIGAALYPDLYAD